MFWISKKKRMGGDGIQIVDVVTKVLYPLGTTKYVLIFTKCEDLIVKIAGEEGTAYSVGK